MDILKNMNLSINQAFRYGYGGLLFLLLYAIDHREEIKSYKDSLGNVLGVLVIFALGALIYIVCRATFEKPIERLIHKDTRSNSFCKLRYLEKTFSVSSLNSLNAYRLIRDSKIFNEERRKRFEIEHSEIHLLYLTSFVFIVGPIILLKAWSFFILWPLAIIFMLLGIYKDRMLCEREGIYIRSLNTEKIDETETISSLLEKAGLCRKA